MKGILFPPVRNAEKLQPGSNRLLIGAYGFEDRSLGWLHHQEGQGGILRNALIFRYSPSKGRNRILDLRQAIDGLGVIDPKEIHFDVRHPHKIEDQISRELDGFLLDMDEIIIDISAMTKLLILACLCKLIHFKGSVRIVYSEAREYSPTEADYNRSKADMTMIAKYPSVGVESIIRLKCLSSIRMQGQPVAMVAFTSFNEQLVRHMLGTISPHRLLFINGRPAGEGIAWREKATQEIHKKLIEEYKIDNALDENGLLKRVTCTLDYSQTVKVIHDIYDHLGNYERLIFAATGSKMQTIGLFFSKMMHPDIHIEYPTPDSYFSEGITKGIRTVHEVMTPRFSEFIGQLKRQSQASIYS